MSVQELKEERRKLFEDVYNLRIPKRVPVTIKVNNDFGIQYAGMDLIDVQWHPEKLEKAADKVCADFFSDKLPFGSRRFPAFLKAPPVMEPPGLNDSPSRVTIRREYLYFLAMAMAWSMWSTTSVLPRR